MVKKVVLAAIMLACLAAAPRAARAGCAAALGDCYVAAAKIDNFWYRSAAGLDCELDFADCIRQQLVGD